MKRKVSQIPDKTMQFLPCQNLNCRAKQGVLGQMWKMAVKTGVSVNLSDRELETDTAD